MTWAKMMIADARNHGQIGKPRRAKVGKGRQGKRDYPDELIALIKLELQTNSVADVAAFHNLQYRFVFNIANGTLRADIKPLELE